jgi:hypothetical protein
MQPTSIARSHRQRSQRPQERESGRIGGSGVEIKRMTSRKETRSLIKNRLSSPGHKFRMLHKENQDSIVEKCTVSHVGRSEQIAEDSPSTPTVIAVALSTRIGLPQQTRRKPSCTAYTEYPCSCFRRREKEAATYGRDGKRLQTRDESFSRKDVHWSRRPASWPRASCSAGWSGRRGCWGRASGPGQSPCTRSDSSRSDRRALGEWRRQRCPCPATTRRAVFKTGSRDGLGDLSLTAM